MAVGAIALVVAAIAVLIITAPERDRSPLRDDLDRPIQLPLSLDDVDYRQGTVSAIDDDEGPQAGSYCGHAPTTVGLLDWVGNRLTDGTSRQRVAQSIARFQSSVDAAAYLGSNSAIVDCSRWAVTTEDGVRDFVVTEEIPAAVLGDETKRFDLEVAVDGETELFLRTLLIRSGPDVAQLSVISADPRDLDALDELAATATDRLGW